MHDWTVSLDTAPVQLPDGAEDEIMGRLLEQLVRRDTHAGGVSFQAGSFGTTVSVLDVDTLQEAAGQAEQMFQNCAIAVGLDCRIVSLTVTEDDGEGVGFA